MAFIRIEIIESISTKIHVIQCGYCKGRGLETYSMTGWEINRFYDDRPCPVCKGKGLLKIEADDILIQDSRCYGCGHDPYNSSRAWDSKICTTCYGAGAQSLTGKLKILY